MKKKSLNNLAFGGILTALTVIFLYIGSLIPTNKIFFMCIAIAIGTISYIKGGIKLGVLTYIACTLLTLLIIPNKLYGGIYALFGVYPLVKLIAERYTKGIEYGIKYIALNGITLATYFIYSKIVYLGFVFEHKYLILIFIIGLQILFYIIDFAFTKFIMFIEDRVLNKI